MLFLEILRSSLRPWVSMDVSSIVVGNESGTKQN